MVIDSSGLSVAAYTYRPYGAFYDGECVKTVENPWKFTGQYYDAEIEQYYLRARQYDPAMMRFTSRDIADVKNEQPLTNHRYLYCLNNSVNAIDPEGKFFTLIGMALGCAIGDAFGKAHDTDVMIKGSTLGIIVGAIGGSLLDIYLFKQTVQNIINSKNMNTIRNAYFSDPNAKNATERQKQTDQAMDAFFKDFTGE